MSVPDTREKLLAAAKQLFLARGYAGTPVDVICENAGVSKGSFYHFFDSKEAFGVAVLEWSLAYSGEVLENGDHRNVSDPVERALAYLRHVENSAEFLWGSGCLLGSFANELADTNPRLQAAVAAVFTTVANDVAARLEPLAAQLGGSPDAGALADQFLVILEGSITLAKAYRDPARITRAVRGFRESLEGLLSLPTA
jgi:TetR/AcrR family transcriptional repressor of nem operon